MFIYREWQLHLAIIMAHDYRIRPYPTVFYRNPTSLAAQMTRLSFLLLLAAVVVAADDGIFGQIKSYLWTWVAPIGANQRKS